MSTVQTRQIQCCTGTRRIRHVVKVLFIVIMSGSPLGGLCSASGFDVILCGGAAMQFATVVNEGWGAGPALQAMVSYNLPRADANSSYSLWVGYERFDTGLPQSTSRDRVQAEYWSVGFRAGLRAPKSPVSSFFILGFGAGTSNPSVVQNSTASLRNSAVQFGIGLPITLTESLAVVPMMRLVVGANSGFTIPITVGMQWRLL